MRDTNRRGFFSLLAGLPLVGAVFGSSSSDSGSSTPRFIRAYNPFDGITKGPIVLERMKDGVLLVSMAPCGYSRESKIPWISVDHRLPPRAYDDLSDIVLSIYGGGPSCPAQYDYELKCWVSIEYHGVHWVMHGVTHWAALPNVPEITNET